MTLSEWKSLGITQVILAELQSRVNQLKEELATSAGNDPLGDRYKTGVIAGYKDVLEIELSDEEAHGD